MRMPANAFRPLLISLGAALLTAGVLDARVSGALPAPGAATQASEAELRSDIAFARGLASTWGFVDLAQEVITRLENSRPPAAIAEEVSLLKCEVFFAAARSDARNRESLLKQAIGAYGDFLSRSSYSDESKASAEAGLVEASSAYARTLAGRLEEAFGDEQTALREEIQTVLSAAAQRAGALVASYKAIDPEEITDAQKRKLLELLLAKAEMYLELAKSQELGAANYERARQDFESLSDIAGEGTPWSMRAMIGLGDVYAAEGEWVDASAFYEFPVSFSITPDREVWAEAVKEMSAEEKQARFLFVQLGTPGLVRSLLAQGGEDSQKAAMDWALHFYNTWRREGLDLVQPQGYVTLLEVARALVDVGGVIGGNAAAGEARWFRSPEEATAEGLAKRLQRPALDFALSLAQTVASENKGTNLLVRAQQVIGEIISRPGIQVDPTVLFDAAQGEFNASEFETAIPAFKRVLASLEGSDQAARAEMMPKVLWHLGRSYARLERTLEAAVTYEAALDSWTGDGTWDEQNATGFNSAAVALRRQAKGDAQIEAMVRKSEQLLAQFSGSAANDILYRSAEASFDAKKYDEAREKYKSISGGNNYEKAIVGLALCDYREGKYEAAIKGFDDYLNKFVPDAKNASTDPTKVAKRREAVARSTFYWGLSLYQLADKGKGDWRAVVDKLGNYHELFPDQTDFAPAALYQTLLAYSKMGEQAQVRRVLEISLTKFPEHRFTGEAARESYRALEASREAEKDEAKRAKLLREMAENLQVVNRTASKPSFANLRRESTHWVELREWAVAEELLERIRSQFSDDPEAEKIMLTGVLPDLGEALVKQYKVQQAAEVLAPLAAEDAKYRASRDVGRNYARALAGWVEMAVDAEGKPLGPKEIPGVGGAASFERAADLFGKLSGSDKWTTPWFEAKFDQFYTYYLWSKLDSKKAETAKRELGFFAAPANLGAQFRHEQMPEDLRQLYVWLFAQVGR